MAIHNFTCPHCKRKIPPPKKFNFENAATLDSPKGFWNSDFTRGTLVLGGIPLVGGIIATLGEFDPFWGAFFGTLGTAIGGSGLLILKWRFEGKRPAAAGEQGPIKIRIAEKNEWGKWRYLRDEMTGVEFSDLKKVAQAISVEKKNFSRGGLRGIISQSKWHKLKDCFIGLHYAVPIPNGANGYVLTIRGKALFRAIAPPP